MKHVFMRIGVLFSSILLLTTFAPPVHSLYLYQNLGKFSFEITTSPGETNEVKSGATYSVVFELTPETVDSTLHNANVTLELTGFIGENGTWANYELRKWDNEDIVGRQSVSGNFEAEGAGAVYLRFRGSYLFNWEDNLIQSGDFYIFYPLLYMVEKTRGELSAAYYSLNQNNLALQHGYDLLQQELQGSQNIALAFQVTTVILVCMVTMAAFVLFRRR